MRRFKRLTALFIALTITYVFLLEGMGPFVLSAKAASPFHTGSGSVSDPYLISTPDELNAVRNYLSSNFELENDIDLTAATSPGGEFYNGGEGWAPIGPDNYTAFTGIFNGNGKTIKGLNISISTGISSYCTYTVTDTDKAGNKTSATFAINKSTPVITAKVTSGSIANNAYTNASVTVSVYGFNVSESVTKNASSFTYPSNGVFSGEGKYIVTAKVGSNSATFTFTIDKTAPVVSGVTSGAYYNVSKKVTFNEGTATLNKAAFTSGSTVSGSGAYTLIVTDKAGNKKTVTFVIDKTAPVITLKNSSGTVVSSGSTVYGDVTATCSDTNANAPTAKKGTASFTYPSGGKFTADGTYTVTDTDKAGNKASATFTINKTTSVITAKIPSGSIANNAYTNASVTVSVYGFNVSESVTKSGSSFTYPSNGVFTADGKYIVTAKVGSNTATFTFTVDKTAPVITGVSSGATYSVIKKITFNEGTATLNGVAFTSGSVATKTGTNTLIVTDKAGNSATVSFTMMVNITYTTYNISLSSLATDNDVSASYVDPNVLAGDPADAYEFMSLKWVDGITADNLTQMLTGRGVLEGHEQDFLDAAQQYNINPVYLIAHARIETANGTSPLSIGQHVDAGVYTDSKGKTVTVSTDGTYYNLFGIHAYNGAVVPDGSQYAASQGWDSVTAAIYGGAAWISKYYTTGVNYPQNTLYQMRFDPYGWANGQGYGFATDEKWADSIAGIIMQYSGIFNGITLYYDIPQYNK